MSAGLAHCMVPMSIHCDHLIQAVDGAASDLEVPILPVYFELSCNRSGYRSPYRIPRGRQRTCNILWVNKVVEMGH